MVLHSGRAPGGLYLPPASQVGAPPSVLQSLAWWRRRGEREVVVYKCLPIPKVHFTRYDYFHLGESCHYRRKWGKLVITDEFVHFVLFNVFFLIRLLSCPINTNIHNASFFSKSNPVRCRQIAWYEMVLYPYTPPLTPQAPPTSPG